MSIRGLDVSNFTGTLSTATTTCWAASGIGIAVVRLSLEDTGKRAIARQQLAALQAAGIVTQGYLWAYFSEDAAATVAQCQEWYGEAGVERVWLDAEETDPRYRGTSRLQREAWLTAAVNALQGVGWATGIYTANWWWAPYMEGSTAFAGLPLWVAEYDNVPDLRVFYPFGGWETCAGKQYAGNGSLCGVGSLDLDVFDEAVVSGGADLSAEERAELENLRNYIGGLTADVLRPGLAAIEAAADGQKGKRWDTVRSQIAAIREGSGVTA